MADVNAEQNLTPQQMVALYLQAEADLVANGKEMQFNGRRWLMAELPQLQAGRLYWERRAAAQSRAGRPGYSLAAF